MASGNFIAALILQIVIILVIAIPCLLRIIFDPVTIVAIITCLATLHIGAVVFSASQNLRSKLGLSTHHKVTATLRSLACLVFIVISVGCHGLLFKYKPVLLGVQIYFIPSMSMYPTLKPGDFVLADTWIYKTAEPQLNDVVLFKKNGVIFVKRVSIWSSGETNNNDLYFVLGDHGKISYDSTSFGGVDKKNIVGRTKLILFSVNNLGNIRLERFLHLVN